MTNTRVARRYAMALMNAAGGDRTVMERMVADLALVEQTLRASRDLRLLVASPVIPAEKKRAVFRALFAAGMGADMMSFLDLLVEKHREAELPAIVRAFNALHDERAGIVNVDITTAVECTPPQQQALREYLERYTRKQVRMRFGLDRAIRGGLVVRIGDTVLDASVRHQLERLRERLVGVSH